MEDIGHKPGLYRWKRQTDARVYSRSQKVTTDNDIHNWIKAVEDASTRAAEQVFGTNHSATRGRTKGKIAALATADQLREHDAVYSEAQELLSQWIDEKVNLDNDDDDFVNENWHQRAVQCDVKKEWDHLLENNYEEYGMKTTPKKIKDEDPYAFLENCDESEAVEMVLQRMLDKKVVKEEFTQDLGLDKWGERKDPRTKMELRHQQVKENREKREKELEKRRRALQAKKEATHKAKQMILKEEHEKAANWKKEEMLVRKEMVKIRKEMQEERRRTEEEKEKEAAMKNRVYEEAKLQVNQEAWEETRQQREQQLHREERERLLKQRLAEVEAKIQAGNLRVLHRHFSAWYNVVLERRLQMGKAKALNDWKLLLRAWNAWKTFVRSRKLDKETKQHEVSIIQTHRKNQLAESHHRHSLLRKYFVAWQQWVHNEQERQELEKAQETTRNKMFALLEAAATGKLWSDKNDAVETTRTGGSAADTRRHTPARNRLEPSNSSEVDAFFAGSVKRPQTSHSDVSIISTERSETEPKNIKHNKIPTQAWQITKKHVNLTKSQIGNLGNGDYDNRSEHSDQKIRKRFGTQPWMNTKYVVNNFENRHAAQQKILQEQQKQLKEQQRLIEELKYGQQQIALKSQLPGGQNSSGPTLSSPPSGPTLTLPPPQANVNVKDTTSPQQLNNVSYVQMLPGQLQQVEHNEVVKEKQTNVAMETARTDANSEAVSTERSGNSSEPMTGRTASTNITQTTSNAKYLAMVQKMEDRAAERARIKAERDEKRRKTEEERLVQLQKEEEELKKQIEEEKRAKAAAFREKKRQEKERELQKQQREEHLKQLQAVAEDHYVKSVMKYRGLLPFKKLLQLANENKEKAIHHHSTVILRKVLMAWRLQARELAEEKEKLADEMYKFIIMKHYFANWRKYKHHTTIMEGRARRYYDRNLKEKVLFAWSEYASREKIEMLEKEKMAQDHYIWMLKKRCFNTLREYPVERIKEKERRKRREEMRIKVASMLPDFEGLKLQTSSNLDETL